jgi:hypothetical protein
MRVKVRGAIDPKTSERFHRYMGESPAHREGWVAAHSFDDYEVAEDYLDPFKELAANFGLAVEPDNLEGAGTTDGTDGGALSG